VYGRLNYTEGVLEVVMVEPVPHLFRNLSDTYANAPNVKPMWGAVCPPDSGATATFYAFKQNATSYEYYNTRLGERQLYSDSVFQIGSFIKRFLWHNSGSSEEEIEEVIDVLDVPCLTLPKIMCNMGWGHVDYLHIDAEGFDDKVVLSSAVEITRPFIIRLEAQHIEGADMITYLESVGYKVLKVRAHGVLELMAVWANLKSLPPSKGLQCKALRSTLS
jgi:FkbM family methyltransferase